MSIDAIGLLLYLLQQFGVTLAVGASTFSILFYIVGLSDGVVDASEKRFMHAVYKTLRVGLLCILITGMLITAAHYFAGEYDVIMAPAYLFKWILLAIIIITATLMDLRIFSGAVGGVIAGASWYALFVVHTLSLSFDWVTLWSVYLAWLVLFWIAFRILQQTAKGLYLKEGATPVAPSRGPHIAEAQTTKTSP